MYTDKAAVIENSFCGFLLTILSYVIIVVTVPFSLCLCLKVSISNRPLLTYLLCPESD